ncbi:MAG: DUF1656 domain-containing protein [Curvibacter sp.]|nr:DUF1656 domain-containing protein [Curvibacter sp.]
MMAEIDLYGVYLPVLLVQALLALLLSTGLRAVVARLGLYRWVWHRSLFNLCLYVIVLGAVILSWGKR